MIRSTWPAALAVLMLAGCAAAPEPSATGGPVAGRTVVAGTATVTGVEQPQPTAAAARLDRAGIRVKGTPLEARQWRDRNGLNLMVASQTDDNHRDQGPYVDAATIFVVLVTDLDGKPHLRRTMIDPSGSCGEDFAQGIADGSVQVTDLDHDGVGEVSIGWYRSCSTDVSPHPVKLAVLTGATKLILRGDGFTTEEANSFDAPAELPHGGFTPEPSAGLWPPGTYEATVRLFYAVFH